MKKRIYVVLMIMFLLVLALAGCKKNKHNFSSDWSFDAQSHWHDCSHCDEVQDKADHSWNEGVVTTKPSTSAKGVKTYTCTVCGATKTEDIAKLTPISEYVAGANNSNVDFTGTVFQKTNEGFLI